MILDPNAVSAWAEGIASVEHSLRAASRLVVPTVVLGEFYFGIRQSRHRARYEDWLRRYLPLTDIAMVTRVDRPTSRLICRLPHCVPPPCGDLQLELKRSGTPIPVNDAWIAALARQHDLPVLSNDSHFDAVKWSATPGVLTP